MIRFWHWLMNLFHKKKKSPLHVPRSFFGYMTQGELVPTPEKVTIPIGTFRIWNVGASFEWADRNNWEGFDYAIKFAAAKGADILYVLAGEPTTTLPPLAEWQAFVYAAVARAAGRLKYWEPWNEPVYCKGATPGDMLNYALAAYKIIKAAQPDAIVLTPSLNELRTAYGLTYAAKYLELLEVIPCADAVAFHSYDPPSDIPFIVSDLKHRTALPLIDTETATEDLTATLQNHAAAGVELVVWNGQEKPANDATSGLGLEWIKESAAAFH